MEAIIVTCLLISTAIMLYAFYILIRETARSLCEDCEEKGEDTDSSFCECEKPEVGSNGYCKKCNQYHI